MKKMLIKMFIKKKLINYLLSIIAIRKFYRFKFDNKLIFVYNFNYFFNYILSIITLREIKRYQKNNELLIRKLSF